MKIIEKSPKLQSKILIALMGGDANGRDLPDDDQESLDNILKQQSPELYKLATAIVNGNNGIKINTDKFLEELPRCKEAIMNKEEALLEAKSEKERELQEQNITETTTRTQPISILGLDNTIKGVLSNGDETDSHDTPNLLEGNKYKITLKATGDSFIDDSTRIIEILRNGTMVAGGARSSGSETTLEFIADQGGNYKMLVRGDQENTKFPFSYEAEMEIVKKVEQTQTSTTPQASTLEYRDDDRATSPKPSFAVTTALAAVVAFVSGKGK